MKTLKTNALVLTALIAVVPNAAFADGDEQAGNSYWQTAKDYASTAFDTARTGLPSAPSWVPYSDSLTTKGGRIEQFTKANSYYASDAGRSAGLVAAGYGAYKGGKWAYNKVRSDKAGKQDQKKTPKKKPAAAPVVVTGKPLTEAQKAMIANTTEFLNYLRDVKHKDHSVMSAEYKQGFVPGYINWLERQRVAASRIARTAKTVTGVAKAGQEKVAGFGSRAWNVVKAPFVWAKGQATGHPYRSGLVAAATLGAGFLGNKSYKKEDGYVRQGADSVKSVFEAGRNWFKSETSEVGSETPAEDDDKDEASSDESDVSSDSSNESGSETPVEGDKDESSEEATTSEDEATTSEEDGVKKK